MSEQMSKSKWAQQTQAWPNVGRVGDEAPKQQHSWCAFKWTPVSLKDGTRLGERGWQLHED